VRILFLTHRLPYAPNRGDRVRAYHLLRLLARHHEVHLVSLVHDRDELSHLGDLASIAASARAASVPTLRNHVAAVATLPTHIPLTHALLSSPELLPAIHDSVAAAPPDVVLAYCTGVAGAVFREPLDSLPCVLDMVDLDSEKWAELAENSHWPMTWIYRREMRTLRAFERQAMARAVVTTVVSERERALVERLLGQPARTVPVGVDVDFWRRPADARMYREIVFCAVFNYEPNELGAIWLASKVWPLVRGRVPDAKLKLVGMNPTSRIRALAVEGSIEVTGAVDDVRPHVWRASGAVAPLWVARGTQTKVLEALAGGLHCVVTPAVLEGLPVSAQSACITRHDAEGFAEAVIQLLERPATGEGVRKIAESVEGLGWDRQLHPFLEIFDEISTGHAVPTR
jgi:sugar transferase (PEP-CTERM/EpsH1 system associated)